jgi:hypothetical protein
MTLGAGGWNMLATSLLVSSRSHNMHVCLVWFAAMESQGYLRNHGVLGTEYGVPYGYSLAPAIPTTVQRGGKRVTR